MYRKDNAVGNDAGLGSLDCSDSFNNGDNSSNEDEEMDVHEETNSHVKVSEVEEPTILNTLYSIPCYTMGIMHSILTT